MGGPPAPRRGHRPGPGLGGLGPGPDRGRHRTEHPVPASLDATLRPYQLNGFNWLAYLYEHRLGGILADDMGLGKTIQALALMCHTKDGASRTSPYLVVAPTSVVGNWATECRRFAPGCVSSPSPRPRPAGGWPWRRWRPMSTWSSPPTPCSASSTTTTPRSTGPGSSSTRPSSPRTGPPRPTGGPRCCPSPSKWP